jgi:hypothetical protein
MEAWRIITLGRILICHFGIFSPCHKNVISVPSDSEEFQSQVSPAKPKNPASVSDDSDGDTPAERLLVHFYLHHHQGNQDGSHHQRKDDPIKDPVLQGHFSYTSTCDRKWRWVVQLPAGVRSIV